MSVQGVSANASPLNMSSFRSRPKLWGGWAGAHNDTQCLKDDGGAFKSEPPPRRPSRGSLFVSSWKNILRVGG